MLAFTPVNLFLSSNALLIIDPSSFIGYYYYLSLILSFILNQVDLFLLLIPLYNFEFILNLLMFLS